MLNDLSSILSANEFAIYRGYIREQSNRAHAEEGRLASELERLNAELEKKKFAVRTLADHERAKLSARTLTGYCWAETLQNERTFVRWPSGDYLGSVITAVERYLRFSGARRRRQRPAWKAIKLFDKRVPSVQLAAQVHEFDSPRRIEIERRSSAGAQRETIAVLAMADRTPRR